MASSERYGCDGHGDTTVPPTNADATVKVDVVVADTDASVGPPAAALTSGAATRSAEALTTGLMFAAKDLVEGTAADALIAEAGNTNTDVDGAVAAAKEKGAATVLVAEPGNTNTDVDGVVAVAKENGAAAVLVAEFEVENTNADVNGAVAAAKETGAATVLVAEVGNTNADVDGAIGDAAKEKGVAGLTVAEANETGAVVVPSRATTGGATTSAGKASVGAATAVVLPLAVLAPTENPPAGLTENDEGALAAEVATS